MIQDNLPEQHRNSPETVSLSDAINKAVEELADRKADVIAQLDLATATWGLALWEKRYAIQSEPDKPADQRRERIRAAMRSKGVPTKEMLENLAESFTNGKVEIVELLRQYKIIFKFVGTGGIPPRMDDLADAIREVLDAHVDFGFSYTHATHGMLKGYTHKQLKTMTHGQIRKDDSV